MGTDIINSLDITMLTTKERRAMIKRLLQYQRFFSESLEVSKNRKRSKEEKEKAETRLCKYYELLGKVCKKCNPGKSSTGKSSNGSEIASLSGAAATKATLVALGGLSLPVSGAGMASSQSELFGIIEGLRASGASEKYINDQMMAMLQTAISMLEKCNVTENEIRSALTNTVRAVTDIKNRYGDDLDENELGKLVQEETAAWILENMDKGPDPDYDKWKKQIERKIGISAWEKMAENSRTFIISAEVLYEQMDGDALDYSVICMAASKALEVEVARRFCGGYIRYLKDNRVSPVPSGVLNNNGEYVSEDSFVFGNITDMTGYYVKNGEIRISNKFRSDCDTFLEYAERELYTSKQRWECKELIKKHVKMIDKVRSDYRNPAAHKSVMRAETAKECLDYLVDIEHVLGIMIDDCKW